MVFWKWWTTVVIMAVMASALEYYIGVTSFIWEKDPTKISVGILSIFSIVTAIIGFHAYQIQFNNKKGNFHLLIKLKSICHILLLTALAQSILFIKSLERN